MFFNDVYGSWEEKQLEKYSGIFDVLGNDFLSGVIGKKCLDIGCGSGLFESFAKPRVKAKIYGIDLSEGGCVIGDGDTLPFKSEAFDSVVSIDTMHLLNGDDFRRVLKKRGFVIFATFFNDSNFQQRRSMILGKLRGFEILTEFELRGKENEYVALARKRYC